MARGTDSVWAMLFWKEWRQQWLTAALLSICCLLGLLAYRGSLGRWPEATDWLLVFLILAPCLGASVFAGEVDDRTAGFAMLLPVSPWQPLLVKYAVTAGLVLLCALPSGIARFLVGPPAADSPMYAFLLIMVPLLATATIALTGALARQGLRGMGILIGCVGLGAAWTGLVYFGEWVFGFNKPERLTDFACYTAVLAWSLAHLWLLASWHGRRWFRPGWRQTTVGVVLLAITPLLCGLGVVAQRHARMDPREVGSMHRSIDLGSGRAFPEGIAAAVGSPDGRQIAVSVVLPDDWLGRVGGTWSVNVDTGQIRRVGSRWRDSYFRSWSPDSSRVRTTGGSVLRIPMSPRFLAWLVWRKITGAKDVRFVDYHNSRRGPRGVWKLDNGSKVVWHREFCEFVGPDGKQRCALPASDDPVDQQWWQAIKTRQGHAVVAALVGKDQSGQPVCHYWRSAPELPRTERRDIPLDPAVPSDLPGARFSNDGQWLLLGQSSTSEQMLQGHYPKTIEEFESYRGTPFHELPLWLVSLADGSCRHLELPGESAHHTVVFTPDSALLLIAGTGRLHIWNLAEARWETGIAFTTEPGSGYSVIGSRRATIALSPQPPWRVAFAAEQNHRIQIADLGTQTVADAFSPVQATLGQTPQQLRVSWFGNDRVLVETQNPYRLWVVKADGSGSRQVLP